MPSLHNVVNPPNRSGRGSHPSIWRGYVVNITASAVWVRIPTLADDDLTATNTIPGDLASGERVIIAAVEGRLDNLVVIAKENPGVPSHLHIDTDIQYPGWGVVTLAAGWVAGAETGFYPGLRYRTDSRFIHIDGHVTGTSAGTISTLPVTPAYSTKLTGHLDGGPIGLTLNTAGVLSTASIGTIYLSATAPLT